MSRVNGYTIGELARMVHDTPPPGGLAVSAAARARGRLTVIPMRGWTRSMRWPETGLRWVPTSTYITDWSSVQGYPMSGLGCILGGFKHGLGTPHPFRLLSHERIDDATLERELRALQSALDHARRAGARRATVLGLANLSDYYLKRGQYDVALRRAQEALPLARAMSNGSIESLALTNGGLALVSMRRKDEGLASVRAALSIDERTVAPSLDKFLNVIRNDGGTVDKVDIWGKRRLAYEIDKKSEGIYAVVDFTAESKTTNELDRQLNLSEAVMRTKVLRAEEAIAQVAGGGNRADDIDRGLILSLLALANDGQSFGDHLIGERLRRFGVGRHQRELRHEQRRGDDFGIEDVLRRCIA